MATASWAVLAELFPQAGARIDERLHAERELALAEGVDVVQAEAHGQIAAADVLNWSAADGHDLPWTGSLRLGADSWVSAPGAEPIGTNWGAVRPWLVESSGQFRPAAPPAVGSPEFEQALDEVRRVSRDRTPEQLALALKWMHPVDGYWNEVAAGLTREAGLSDEATARMLTLMNAAIVDAVATCFDTKYEYQYPRPSHIDGSISMAVPLPNHPSFVSGHACVSGAASAVLSHFFPTKAPELLATAEEIALSRLYAGVHYRFDNEVGLSIGRAIAKHAIDLDPSSEDVLGR